MIEATNRVEIADVEALDGGGVVMHCRIGNRVVWVPMADRRRIMRQLVHASSLVCPLPTPTTTTSTTTTTSIQQCEAIGGGVPPPCRLGVAHCTGTVPDLCVQDHRVDAERVIEAIAPVDTCPNGCPPAVSARLPGL